MRLLVIGASGGTGREIVREALAQGHEVTALVRSATTAVSLLPGAELVEGDALDPAATGKALAACDAVISSLGPKLSPIRKVTLLSEATRVLVAGMRARSVRRLVCITGMGAGDSRGHGGFFYDRVFQPLLLGPIYRDKDRQEAIVADSGLDWTIVRPTVLSDKPGTGRIRALTDLTGFHGGSIPRADVARFIVDQAHRDEWIGKAPLITAEASQGLA